MVLQQNEILDISKHELGYRVIVEILAFCSLGRSIMMFSIVIVVHRLVCVALSNNTVIQSSIVPFARIEAFFVCSCLHVCENLVLFFFFDSQLVCSFRIRIECNNWKSYSTENRQKCGNCTKTVRMRIFTFCFDDNITEANNPKKLERYNFEWITKKIQLEKNIVRSLHAFIIMHFECYESKQKGWLWYQTDGEQCNKTQTHIFDFGNVHWTSVNAIQCASNKNRIKWIEALQREKNERVYSITTCVWIAVGARAHRMK